MIKTADYFFTMIQTTIQQSIQLNIFTVSNITSHEACVEAIQKKKPLLMIVRSKH